MKDLWYLQHKDWFSDLAFQALQKYFKSRSDFDVFVNSIVADEEKSRFLKVASHYKFLVKDGRFSVAGYEEAKDFDETYRFLAICALIELVEPNGRSEGWLCVHRRFQTAAHRAPCPCTAVQSVDVTAERLAL
jgi:hypothetical protein